MKTSAAVKAKISELKAAEKRDAREKRRVKDSLLAKRAAAEVENDRKAKLKREAAEAADRVEAELLPTMPYAHVHMGNGKSVVIALAERDAVNRGVAAEAVRRACHAATMLYLDRVAGSRNVGRVLPAVDNTALLAENDGQLRPGILAGVVAIASDL